MVRADRLPRQRLTPETRRASILNAACEAFAELPFEQVGLDQIARRAAASKALILKYFGSKAELYAAVVEQAVAALDERLAVAVSMLPGDCSAIETVRVSIGAYLDHIEQHPRGWSEPLLATHAEPAASARVRIAARDTYVHRLARLFDLPATTAQSEFAFWGYFALLDEACLRWVDRGCPEGERESLIRVASGALAGAVSEIQPPASAE